MNLGKIDTSLIKEQVYEKCRDMIFSGSWKPGDKIPSENQLCEFLGVSRVSVRSALQSLEAQGYIEIRRGEGSFVKPFSISSSLELLYPIMALGEKDIVDVLQFRLILEPHFMPYVVQEASKEDIAFLEDILDEMDKRKDDTPLYARLDEQFHLKLVDIISNTVLSKVYTTLLKVFNSTWQEVCETLGPEAGLYYHGCIIEAIKKRDIQEASRVMEEHVLDTYNRVKKIRGTVSS